MEIKFHSQMAGKNTFYEKLNSLFYSSNYTTFRGLIAYVSWDGLKLIHKAVEYFYDNNQKMHLIIGLGGNYNEIHSLRYLLQRMPNGAFYIFGANNPNYTFHPKVFFFSGNKKNTVLIGSNNLTQGGIYSNSECSIEVNYDKGERNTILNSIEDIWRVYSKSLPPFNKNHLKKVTAHLISSIEKKYNKQKKDNSSLSDQTSKSFFGDLSIPNPPKSDLVKPPISMKKNKSTKTTSGNELFLEVLKETGAKGTQVQIPYKVLLEYFDVKSNHKTIQIKWENDSIRPAVLCSFSNYTYRFSLPEISAKKRPLLLRFIKKSKDEYHLKSIESNDYKKNIRLCKNQSRKGAKRWVIN